MMTRQLAILDDAQRSPLLLGETERSKSPRRGASCGLSGCDEKSRAFLEEKGRAQKHPESRCTVLVHSELPCCFAAGCSLEAVLLGKRRSWLAAWHAGTQGTASQILTRHGPFGR